MAKNVIVMVKEHDGFTATDYFMQLERAGYRVDKIKLFSVHYPDNAAPPFKGIPEISGIGGLLGLLRSYGNLLDRTVLLNGGRTHVIPIMCIQDPNPD